jgi:ABC-type transporter MlaC component
MAWRRWRGLFAGSVAALLLTASATVTLAQTTPQASASTTVPPAPKPAKPAAIAAKPAKPAPIKSAAKTAEPAHPASKAAAATAKPPAKAVAAAKKPTPAATVLTAAKKPTAATKLTATAPRPAPPSYTVTTTRGNVTYTATRIVPLASTPGPVVATAPPAPATRVVPLAPAPISVVAATPPAAAPPVPVVASTPPAAAPLAVAARAATPPEIKVAALPVSQTRPIGPSPAKPVAPPAATAPPPDSGAAVSFVSNFLRDSFHIAKLNGATSLQRRARLADLFAGKMDMKQIAGYTTADELTAMSSDIQQRFRTILVSYLVETYYPRLELASDPSVIVETTAAPPLPDGTAVVWTTFTKDGWGSQSVKWRLAMEDGGFRIVDIFSAGASLVQMERDTFVSVMRNGGVSELMAKLDARTKQLATAATE